MEQTASLHLSLSLHVRGIALYERQAMVTGSLAHMVHLLHLTRADERQQGRCDGSKFIWSGGFVTLAYITS